MMMTVRQIRLIFAFLMGFSGLVLGGPEEMVRGLGVANYFERESAEKRLNEWANENGKVGLARLRELLEGSRSPEVRSRLERVISSVVIYEGLPGTKGYMGVRMMAHRGVVLLTDVLAGTPAARCGLEVNDKVIAVDGINVIDKNGNKESAKDFLDKYVKGKKAGEKLTLKVLRGEKMHTMEMKLGIYKLPLVQHNERLEKLLELKAQFKAEGAEPGFQDMVDKQIDLLIKGKRLMKGKR